MTDTYGMTKRQHETLTFIEAFIDANGYSPSFQEVKDHLGLASKSGVHRIVHALKDRGLLRLHTGHRHRSIALGPDEEQALAGIGL